MIDYRDLVRIPVLSFFGAVLPAQAPAQDWDAIPSAQVKLFQPGQASWEWLLISSDHGTSGARRTREGRPCLSCHQGEETAIGNAAVSGERFDPAPMAGMPGSIELEIEGTVTDGILHLRLSWPVVERAGPAGDSRYAAKVTVLIADEGLPAARGATCWASCHSDLSGMSADAGQSLTKYLPNSRASMTRTGGGDNLKPPDELVAELEKGAFLEFWSAKLEEEGAPVALDGYILDARRNNDVSEISAAARREGDRRIVELQRPLLPDGGPRKALIPGRTYPVSFAVHESNTEHRRHYVSFPLAMTLRADGIVIEEVVE